MLCDRRQRLGVARFQIIEREVCVLDLGAPHRQDIDHRLAGLQVRGAFLESAMQGRRRRPLGWRQVGVAGRHREAILLAHGRQTDDPGRNIQVARHGGHDPELLVVLLAEHREVGRDLQQQLGHHGADAAEEMRAEFVFEAGQRRSTGRDPGREAVRIHGGDARRPDHVDFLRRQRLKIGIPSPRVA